MRIQTRSLDAAGETAEDVAGRVLDALAEGMVLLRRRVTAGEGGAGRVLSTGWVLMRPVLDGGVVAALVEDEGTRRANAVGRHLYGIRPGDIDQGALREICPDVFWLGPAGAVAVATRGHVRPVDLWSSLRPSAVNHVPAYDGQSARTLRTGSDPEAALAKPKKAEREALAAMLEGLHLVDAARGSDAGGRRTDARTWTPLRPRGNPGARPEGYGVDRRVRRHTANAGRTGFSNTTFANLSPLLVEAGYDPRDADLGHAYTIAHAWIDRVRARIDWADETEGVTAPCADEAVPTPDERVPEERHGPASKATAVGVEGDDPTLPPVASTDPPTPRQAAILAMLAGATFEALGDDPSHAEVADAIAHHGGEPANQSALIASALSRAVAAARGRTSMFPWLRR